jgi:hypothetical protein
LLTWPRKKVYEDKTAAYNKAVAKWQQNFGRNLEDNGIDLSPKLIGRGLYTLNLIIIPETETNQTWKIRLVTRLESKDRKAKQFKVISIEKRDFQIILSERPCLPNRLFLMCSDCLQGDWEILNALRNSTRAAREIESAEIISF